MSKILLSLLLVSQCLAQQPPANDKRNPQILINGIEQILKDLQNEKIFNAKTCPSYINNLTDYLFYLPASQFIPISPKDIEYFKSHGDSMIKKIFLIRVKLHDHLQKFDENNQLSNECLLKIREGIQYARFTEEYLLEWMVHNNVVHFQEKPVLEGEEPFVLLNPEFKELQLMPGDVMLIRGKSYVSAMIARIADEEGNFSHLAIVGEDEKGHLQVVESLIQQGVVVTPLEEWRKVQDSRVALFRFPDKNLSERAAHLVYEWGLTHPQYDFAMDDSKYDKAFCSEVVRYAYDKASDGKIILPKYRSHVSKFKGGPYPRSLGVTESTLFAPYDIEVDPRFDFVAESKYYPLLRQVRMQDSILQSIYQWMIDKNYNFHDTMWISTQTYLGKILRQIGFLKDLMPTYMPIQTIRSTLQFETVAEALEKNLYQKEDEYYKAHGYLPSFQEMMLSNDEYRKQDCVLYAQGKKSKFHYLFRGPGCH